MVCVPAQMGRHTHRLPGTEPTQVPNHWNIEHHRTARQSGRTNLAKGGVVTKTNPETTAKTLSHLEKIALLSGKNVWETRAVPRIGLKPILMSDGPHGVRKQAGSGDHLGLNPSVPATCFPTAATLSNSWDPELGETMGAALGREASQIGVDVLLGPGINIKRSPLGGRNFEYISEDPYLAGKLGAALVRGIQSAGVAACPKHFAVNSQETRRMTSNSVIDEGTLREIYLTAFEILVKESHPKTIMSSYNLLNGTYTNEHAQLLTDILRREWGFDGLVVTDWGGANDAKAAIEAGGTLEMPSPGYDSVVQLLAEKNLDEDALNARVAEVIQLAERINPVEVDESIFVEDNALAQAIAEQCIVLLKNDGGILPLAAGTKVAVIGEFAFTPRYQGAGSSKVNSTEVATAVDAMRNSGFTVVATEKGFDSAAPLDAAQRAASVAAASQADVVLMYLGLDDNTESEGKDRDHMSIPACQVELLEAVAAANPNVVVVLAGGSPIEMPWLGKAKALAHGYLGGQAGAPAMVRVLNGSVNPSGHLAETYAHSLAETPTAGNFPATQKHALYREGPFVGYRYYSTTGTPVLFPFGFGLSYTEFEYSDFTATPAGASVTVTNTGTVAGADVVQFYATAPDDVKRLGPTPSLRLVGFQKVTLAAGESTRVEIAFDEYSFRAFDRTAAAWTTVGGEYLISVGHDVVNRPFEAPATIAGDAVGQAHPSASIASYASGAAHVVTDADFAVLLGSPVPREPAPSEPLHLNSPLSDLKNAKSGLGRLIYSQYFARGMRKMEESGEPNLDMLFQYGMPFRAIFKMSGGMADSGMVQGILTLVNGKFFKGLGQIVKGYFANNKRQKALDAELTELAAGSTTTRIETLP